ncbi:MAG: amino acid racemase [Candidatus Levyibacteriota bacterium]|nr:MAG: amino acid racemase [Candidatus Levybacteria bacterium]
MGGVHEKFLESANKGLAETIRIPRQVRVPLVVGGLGPLAHIPLLEALLTANPSATKDQDHPGYGLVSATSITDRTDALKKQAAGNPNSYYEVGGRILAIAQQADKEGFDFFVVICNTAHAWREDLEPYLPIPWVPLMGSAVAEIKEKHPNAERVGILGTDGTMMTGLYTKAVTDAGIFPINLDLGSPEQNAVMSAIYDTGFGVKATGTTVSNTSIHLLTEAADYLVSARGAEVIIGGCTEIPPALKGRYKTVPFIDPVDSLAQAVLKLAMNKNVDPKTF